MNEGQRLFGRETYKAIKKAQKMLDYIEAYDHLIEKDIEFFAQALLAEDKVTRKKYRKYSDTAHQALKDVAERVLHDKQVWS